MALAAMKQDELEQDMQALREYEQRKKNPPFVQFTNPAGLEAIELLGQSNPKAFQLFMFLCRYMDLKNAVACSQTLLCEALQCSRPTISRAVAFLKDNRYIAVARMGTSNIYHLNADLVWKTEFDKKPMAQLQGTILLSLSEQEEEVRKKVSKQLSLL